MGHGTPQKALQLRSAEWGVDPRRGYGRDGPRTDSRFANAG